MSSPVLLWLDAAWILGLAFVAIVVRREFPLVKALVEDGGGAVVDGPDVGSLLPRGTRATHDRVIVFLFGDCAPCHDVGGRLHRLPPRLNLEVVIGDGGIPGSSTSLRQLLPDRPAVSIRAGDAAERIRAALGVRSGPLAVVIRNNIVTAKGSLRDERDILRMTNTTPDLELIRAFGRAGVD